MIRRPGLTEQAGTVQLPQAFELLRTRGPFILGGIVTNVGGHAIVINGAPDDQTWSTDCIDPRFGREQTIPWQSLRVGFRPDGKPAWVF